MADIDIKAVLKPFRDVAELVGDNPDDVFFKDGGIYAPMKTNDWVKDLVGEMQSYDLKRNEKKKYMEIRISPEDLEELVDEIYDLWSKPIGASFSCVRELVKTLKENYMHELTVVKE